MTRPRLLAGALAAALLGVVAGAPAPAYAAAEDAVAGELQLPGEETEESSDVDAPAPVGAGVWRGTLGPYESDGGVDFFAYERTTEESTLLVSVLSNGADPMREDGIELGVATADGDACLSSTASASRIDDDPTVLTVATWVGVQREILSSEDGSGFECLEQDTLVIAVARGLNGEEGDAPYSLRIVEEQPLASADGLPDVVGEVEEATEPDVEGEPEEIEAASSFADAPELEPGRYTGTLTTDSTALFRVPDVGWGTELAASLFLEPADLPEDSFTGPDVTLRLLDPMMSSARGSELGTLRPEDDAQVRTAVSSGPVRYLNRRESGATYLPGDYYLLVTVDPVDGDDQIDLGYELTVDVTGEEDDAPDFDQEDAYLVAADSSEPVITAVDASALDGLLGGLRYGGAAVLALLGLVAMLLGVRTLRA